MAYTQYEQMQSTTFTQVMSNIGGNMGMTLGMSLISIIEIIVYFSKASWIFLSKKRREHLVEKKRYEKVCFFKNPIGDQGVLSASESLESISRFEIRRTKDS